VALGCEGIVSKRLGSPYRPGSVDHWLKIKNADAPDVTRETEEEWAIRFAPDFRRIAVSQQTTFRPISTP